MANVNYPVSKYQPNLLHVLEAWVDKKENTINGLIEINSGSVNKYEFITETGHLKLDRVGYSSLKYPVAYGAIPKTLDQDGDMLDFIVANVLEPIVSGALVEARVIGIIKFEDDGEIDDKIITVLASDKRSEHIVSYKDLGGHWQKEVEHYFEYYKHLKKPGSCKVLGFYDVDEAHNVIEDCIERYDKELKPKVEG
ncbi:inorganic diphosphatase [Candidatus Nomurabacteria bacterium]|nr:inorganic diphosphatase [Candidatus Nomurabacteria bacterium]